MIILPHLIQFVKHNRRSLNLNHHHGEFSHSLTGGFFPKVDSALSPRCPLVTQSRSKGEDQLDRSAPCRITWAFLPNTPFFSSPATNTFQLTTRRSTN